MRFLLAIGLGLLGAPVFAADDFTAEKAKALIPEAAGMSSNDLLKLSEDPRIDNFKPARGDSLTWLVISHRPRPAAPKEPASFRFLSDKLNPAELYGTIMGPKDKDGNFRKTATVIQPELITDCSCNVDGNTATGTVTFKAEKLYEGKVEYTAKQKDGVWRIEEFRLPDLKWTTALGRDGKWVKK